MAGDGLSLDGDGFGQGGAERARGTLEVSSATYYRSRMNDDRVTERSQDGRQPEGVRTGRRDSRAHAATVVGVVLAGVLTSIVVPGPYDFGSTMIGLVLLATLYGYGEPPTDRREAVGFAAAVGICLLLVFGVLLDRFINISGWPTPDTLEARWKIDDAVPWWTGGWRALLAWLGFSLSVYAYLWHRGLPHHTHRATGG